MADLESEVELYRESCSIYDELQEYINYIKKSVVKELNIVHLNVSSIRKNWSLVRNILDDETQASIDIIVLTEISIYKHENILYKINDFNNLFFNRIDQKGGGICVFIRDDIVVKEKFVGKNENSGHECVHIEIELRDKIIDIIAVYRPPEFNSKTFVDELVLLLQNINQTHEIIIIGDINIDLLQQGNVQVINYQNVLAEHGLGRCIYGVTREVMRNGMYVKSCIDHIFVRTSKKVISTIIHTHISDHYMVALTLYKKEETIEDKNKVGNNYNKHKCIKYDENTIKNILKDTNWEDKIDTQNMSNTTTETLYIAFTREFTKIYTSNKKEVINKNRKRLDKGWITGEIRSEIKKRDLAFKKWKGTPSNVQYRNEYKSSRNRVNQNIRKRKNEYALSEIEKVKGCLKKTWHKVNEIIGRSNKKNPDEMIIKSFGKQYSIADILKRFAMEFTQGVRNIVHDCKIQLCNKDDESINCSMFIPEAKCKDIQNIIKKMSCNKSPGIDNVRMIDIRNSNETILKIITKLINLSLKEGIIPKEMKISIIKPIYKQGQRNEFSNYRPIAILSNLEKILERYISIHVKKFLTSQNIINEHQYGFQRGRSTSTLLENFTNFINSKLNNNKVIIALFIDYSKAFDTINHNILIEILENTGIRGKILNWFKNYLEDRCMKIKINNELSSSTEVKYGVPQGSILGPTLYTLYVNSIFKCIGNCEVYMFADDTAMLSVHTNVERAQFNMQKDYNNLLKWSHDKGLRINEKKTKLLCITTSKRNVKCVKILSHTYNCLHNRNYDTGTCNCPAIEEVKVIKYLGMWIDNRFTWNSHIDNLCKSLRGCLSQFYRLQYCVSIDVLRNVYYALVQSVIRYGLQCYGISAATHLKKIEILNKKIVKIIAKKQVGLDHNEIEQDEIYKLTNILPINKLYIYTMIVENYNKIEYKNIPDNVHNLRLIKLRIPMAFNKYGEKQLKVIIPKLFNLIPTELRKIEQIGKLKYELRKWLLGIDNDN